MVPAVAALTGGGGSVSLARMVLAVVAVTPGADGRGSGGSDPSLEVRGLSYLDS